MNLPDWVKAECRREINKPTPSMEDRVARVKEAAYKCGYLYDHVEKAYIYVGTEPEPHADPRGPNGRYAQK